MLLFDVEKVNNEFVKGKDVFYGMVFKLEEKKKKYKEIVKILGKYVRTNDKFIKSYIVNNMVDFGIRK